MANSLFAKNVKKVPSLFVSGGVASLSDDDANASSIIDNLGNPVPKAATLTITRSPQFVFF